jgi:polyether ionophore transport system permease protein
MTAELGPVPSSAGLTPVTTWNRIYGFGSVYAKTLRDSRLAFIIVAGLLGGVMLTIGAAIPNVFSSQAARDEIVRLATELGGVAQGMSGKPVNIGSLGGYIQWKYGPIFLVIAALWSILALSSTLATEARRGSLEFVAATPFGKRRIALEKLAAHLTVLTAALVLFALSASLVGALFGTLPEDAIPAGAAIGFALWLGLMSLAFGGLSFALAQYVGRSLAAGIAGALLIGGYVLSNYSASVPSFGTIAYITPWKWTADHLPLAGQYDWASLVPVAIVAVVLLAAGVEAFARRDLGATSRVRFPAMPALLIGQDGPIGRSFGERLPTALGWGLGMGLFGLMIAGVSGSLADSLMKSPDLMQTLANVFPNLDLTTAGGFLQLVFVELGFIVVGFAAATLAAGWASDETSGRLEVILASPLGRRSWAVRSGLGVYLAIAVMTAILALGIGIGAASAGSDALTPMAGTIVMGLYTAAMAGIGFAVGGLVRASLAGEVVALIVVATFLIDLLAPALRLPDWVHQLALTGHLGQPMIGTWDWPGMVACLVLALGGLALAGWGMRSRDVAA